MHESYIAHACFCTWAACPFYTVALTEELIKGGATIKHTINPCNVPLLIFIPPSLSSSCHKLWMVWGMTLILSKLNIYPSLQEEALHSDKNTNQGNGQNQGHQHWVSAIVTFCKSKWSNDKNMWKLYSVCASASINDRSFIPPLSW